MDHLLDNLSRGLASLIAHLPLGAAIVGILWGIHILNWICRYRLNIFGIYPRKAWGLIGIPFCPLLHKDFRHLFMNSIPLFILLSFIFVYGTPVVVHLTFVIVLVSGLGIWLFGRKGVHIGASAVVMGYFGFILAIAIHTHSPMAIIIAAITLFYLGSLFTNLFPISEGASWEGHLAGFIAGIGYVFW